MTERAWWQKPLRVMQYNLQVKDTPGMDAEAIAEETERLAANTVVMNVGGIYAWYPSEVRFHHINEYLPKDRDLLKELIDSFHKRGIRFIARFDFSITDDTTFLQKPQWFARDSDNKPYFRGEKRMGNWSLFLNTCSLGGYRNEEFAVPVMREVLTKYDIDGVFLNAPHARECFCARCRAKYLQLYGKEMPASSAEFEPGWLSACTKENIAVIYRAIKETRADVPLVLYYSPYSTKSRSFGRFIRDSIYDRYQTADLICTESQNVLSHGVRDIPDTVHPIISMKSGQIPGREKLPFGIIHSCPGMDWRHVGMPVAEYLPWMAQVPASGGIIWHSVTGYPASITDKRVLRACGQIDRMIQKQESFMEGASYRSDVCVLWKDTESAKGLADAFVKEHVQFDLMQDYDFRPDDLAGYKLVAVPDGLEVTDEMAAALKAYVQNGGRVLAERTDEEELARHAELYGIEPEVVKSEYLLASYLRFEEAGQFLNPDMDTDKIEFRGEVAYCVPADGISTLATLVPPFAPYEVVGAPPERASIPVSHTDLPLILSRKEGRGEIITLPFSLGSLVREYHLADHYDLVGRLVDGLLGVEKDLEVTAPHDVQVTAYQKDSTVMVHFVNEVGQRPLLDTNPVYGLSVRLRIPDGYAVKNVKTVIEEEDVSCEERDGWLTVTLGKVSVWEMLKIDLEKGEPSCS